ncbi:MAG: TIGR03546 family protein [Spirochaetaceae bacterium]|jgi:uncharacterized protein (TIGR03546 family)|nr:TIGR03546 family protein [Spirochaetaceae bacterium]
MIPEGENIMLKAIAKLAAALNGNTRKDQIALGFSWGLLLALIPAGNFFWIVLFVLSFLFRHHHGSKMLVMAVVKLFTPLLYPALVDPIGWEVLHIEPLAPFYTALYNMPFVPFTRFNNTLVAGGLAAGIALFIPVFIIMLFAVSLYRTTILPKILSTRLFRTVSGFPLVAKLARLVSAFQNDID